jgi:regulatory protein
MTSKSSASDLAQPAMGAALRLLSIRSRSRRELRMALSRKGFAEAQQELVLSRLAELGYVDDLRFARDRAGALLRNGKLGPGAIIQRLCAHGLSEEQAKQALAQAQGESGVPPVETARRLLEKRSLAGRPLSPTEQAKAARLLRARGFADSTIEELLGAEVEIGFQER